MLTIQQLDLLNQKFHLICWSIYCSILLCYVNVVSSTDHQVSDQRIADVMTVYTHHNDLVQFAHTVMMETKELGDTFEKKTNFVLECQLTPKDILVRSTPVV